MKMPGLPPRWIMVLAVSALALATLACQLTSPPKGSEPASAIPAAHSTPDAGPADGTASNSGPASKEAQEPLDAEVAWFQPDASNPKFVRYCIIYTNRNTSQAQFNSLFRIMAYDAGGNQLDESSAMIGWVLPGQSLPVGGLIYLDSGQKVERLEVKPEGTGQLAAPPGGKNGPLSVENASFFTINRTPTVVGVIRNSLNKTLMGIEVTALAYDAGGKLVDASTGQLSFVSAGQQAAVQVELRISEPPARVELHPALSGSAEFLDAQTTPIAVEKAGALLSGGELVRAIFVLKNNAARAYASSYYIASLYDSQGKAVAAATGEVPFISPGSRIAYVTHIPFAAGAAVTRLEVQVQPRPDSDSFNQGVADVTSSPLAAEQAKYIPEVSNNGKVTALVRNTYGRSVDSVSAVAVLYDAAGQIVGGGETGIGALPASEQTQVEIPVGVEGDVAQVEVFPQVNNPSSLLAGSGSQPVSPGGPKDTPTPSAEAPEILSQWFARSSGNPDWVNFAFLVENPNPSLELRDAEYQALAYDSAGLVLNSVTGYIGLLPAGQRLGVVNNTIVKDTDTIAKLEITLTQPGQPQTPASSQPPLRTGQATYSHYQEWDVVSGVVNNSLNREITGVAVNALAFGADGQIVGAGNSFGEYFVPAGGQTPVAVRVNSTDKAVRGELYPLALPGHADQPSPAGLQPLKAAAAGFTQNPESPADVTVAFVVENPNSGQAVFGANYQVALYDQTGALLATSSSYMNPLPIAYPGGKTAKVVQLNVPRETQVARVEVLMGQGRVKDAAGQNPLQSDKATYIATPFPKVTGLILNTSGEEVKRAEACAVLYDKAGRIIGGGNASLDGVPANGRVPVEIMVKSSEAPASVEIYAGMDTFGMNP